MQDQGLDRRKCVVVCTEGAASMIDCHLGANAKIRKVANKLSATVALCSSPFSAPLYIN